MKRLINVHEILLILLIPYKIIVIPYKLIVSPMYWLLYNVVCHKTVD